jgi:outer membrane lipoprotein SlyB
MRNNCLIKKENDMKKLSLLAVLALVASTAVTVNLDARRHRNRDRITDLGNGKIEVCRRVGRSRGEKAGLGILGGGATGALIGGAAGGGRGAGIGFGVGAATGAMVGASSGEDYDCYVTTKREYYGR